MTSETLCRRSYHVLRSCSRMRAAQPSQSSQSPLSVGMSESAGTRRCPSSGDLQIAAHIGGVASGRVSGASVTLRARA
jgi:hypothetical protein